MPDWTPLKSAMRYSNLVSSMKTIDPNPTRKHSAGSRLRNCRLKTRWSEYAHLCTELPPTNRFRRLWSGDLFFLHRRRHRNRVALALQPLIRGEHGGIKIGLTA